MSYYTMYCQMFGKEFMFEKSMEGCAKEVFFLKGSCYNGREVCLGGTYERTRMLFGNGSRF